jgi:hypothetical protein
MPAGRNPVNDLRIRAFPCIDRVHDTGFRIVKVFRVAAKTHEYFYGLRNLTGEPAMRWIAIIALLALAACTTTPPPPPETRTFAWGTTRAEVLSTEPSEPEVAPADRLVYHVERAGIPLTLSYRFGGNGLEATHWFNRSSHEDNNRYIDDYERLKSELIDRHGMPRLDRMAWRNRMLADEPSRYGDAVAAGHLVYFSEWDTERGKIVMALRNDRLQVAHELVYKRPEE